MRLGLSATCFLFVLLCGVTRAQQPTRGPVILTFEDNTAFSQEELEAVTDKCFAANSYAKSEGYIDYCLDRLKLFLSSNGYLRATVTERRRENTPAGLRVGVRVKEGIRYRFGYIQVEGSKLFTPQQLLATLKTKTGDIANTKDLMAWAYQTVKKMYAEHGYLQYTAEIEPKYRDNTGGREGVVDLKVTVDEGDMFKLRSLKFAGNADITVESLLQEMVVRPGDVFNQLLFEASLKRINQTGEFETIDPDRDIDYKTDTKSPLLDVTIHLKKKIS
jgi:outer membrane protein assembly factor BamA